VTAAQTNPSRLTLGSGCRYTIGKALDDYAADRVLVVASPRAIAAADLPRLLDGRTVCWFDGFAPNPTLEHALAGRAAFDRHQPQAVLAVGGGSAIDTAKLIRGLPATAGDARRVLSGDLPPQPETPPPLLALPTTAGSGSEVTSFATVYVDGVKASLDRPSVRPEHALVDPDLLRGCPTPLSYACAFDALCHAVESYWSVRSTPESRTLALRALDLLADVFGPGLPAADDTTRSALARAATTAGMAIDITRTTAAHAFAYHLTAQYGVPHGVACLLNLIWVFDYNLDNVESHCIDPRGSEFVRERLRTVAAALDRLPRARATTAETLRELLASGGYATHLNGFGVNLDGVSSIVASGLASGRSTNNPVSLHPVSVGRHVAALV